jgi:hypothetical protein
MSEVVFDVTRDDLDNHFHGVFTLLCIHFSWSASSVQLYKAVKSVEKELGTILIERDR